jgi:16S rRNA processing protein RimM
MADGRVALAAVAGAHGIRGEVRLKLFADSADSLKTAKRLFVGGAERKLAGLNAADLPPLDDGEYYHADLIGLPCTAGDGAVVGTVSAVENYGAGDLLEIELADGRKSLIPFKAGIADLADGRIVLDRDFLA